MEGGVHVCQVGDGERGIPGRGTAGANAKRSENLGISWGGEKPPWLVAVEKTGPEVGLERYAGPPCGGLVILSLESKGEPILLR